MLIDWFTVAAQTLNFLILVWLLKHFLYKPILDAIDAREQLISSELADAAKKQTEAKQERDTFHQKNAEFEMQRSELLQKATDTAAQERERLLGDARTSADVLTARRKLALQREQQNLESELSRLTRTEVIAIAKKTLQDLANVQFDVCAIRVFIERLHSLDDDAKNLFSSAIKNSKNSVLIRTAFELPDAQHAELQQVINVFFSADVSLIFETAPNAIGGIELSVQGHVLAWTIDNYLGRLEQGITDIVTALNSKEDTSSSNIAALDLTSAITENPLAETATEKK